MLTNNSFIVRILFLAKPDSDIYASSEAAIEYLWSLNLDIVLEEKLYNHIKSKPFFLESKSDVTSTLNMMSLEDKSIDLIITFGGDGLLLHCNTMFTKRNMPPVMCFDFGSLGFLSPFYYEDFRSEVCYISF